MSWFDAGRCAVGLDRLRAYRKRWNKATASYAGPLHDAASHGADAFGEFAVNRRAILSGSDIEIKNGGVSLGELSPEMTRLYPGVVDAWRGAGGPRPVITSGNDGKHRKGSRHYSNHALDFRGNNVDAATAEEIRRRLQEHAGADYDVIYETFPNDPSRNHFHVEYDPKPKRR